ncbi:hypothetical protein [Marinobacter sp. LV10MA510-1]|uniref:hypothetical protein n=1 Tax=Marinobacter sp. LV10MA510-1 TaxID=1415567 RepID=UPI00117F797C|nr:hypothetical protein [Marinobacter sp. LV10MA510-1]
MSHMKTPTLIKNCKGNLTAFSDVLGVFFQSTPLKLVAFNNYSTQTTFGKLKHADAIVATRKNDLPMSIRDRGPFWIIFPLIKRPDLENEDFYRLMSWQLSDIIIGESQ